ncbi:MAG: universal stress protein [Rhodopirellula sp.]|nr:universal stress protein [Rhodopirellula sp.]
MKTKRPLLVLRPDGTIDALCAALRRLTVDRRVNGRVIIESLAGGNLALERKLDSWNCHDEPMASAHRAAQRLAERLMDYTLRIGIEIRTRLTPDDVAQAAQEHCADLVLVSRSVPKTRFSGLVPSVESRLCRLVRAPVWCAGNRPLSERIAVAIDPDATSAEAKAFNVQLVMEAVRLAQQERSPAEIHIIGAWRLFGIAPGWWRRRDRATAEQVARTRRNTEQQLDDLSTLAGRSGGKAKLHVKEGASAVAISRVVQKVDPSILVIGNRQRSGVSRVLHPNTAEAVLKRVSCSVFVVLRSEPDEQSTLPSDSRQSVDHVERPGVNAVA